jgi:hypothetical protein
MIPHDLVTVLLAPQTVNKHVRIVDGQVQKAAGPPISCAKAYTVPVPDADAFARVLRWVADRTNAVLIQGYAPDAKPGEQFLVMSKARITERTGKPYSHGWVEVDGTRAMARIKDNFHPSSWWQLDRDYADGITDALSGMCDAEWVRTMTGIMPGFDTAARIRVASTSGRVMRDGVPLDSQGCRYWFQVEDPTDFNFGARLKLQAAVNGLGFLKRNCNGIGTLWAPFDPTVFSWERIVFDGKPSIGPGLELRAPDIQVTHGGRVDTRRIPELNLAQTEQLKRDYGTHLRVNGSGQVSEVQVGSLRLDTPIATQDHGTQTPLSFYLARASKWRCQAAFRDSDSWNGFLFQDHRGMPVLYDNGTRTRYELSPDEQVALAATGRGAA